MIALLVFAFGVGSCRRTGPSLATAMPKQATCGIVKAPSRPLVVEWPSGDRLDLERRLRSELIVVRYEGCDMEVLAACRVAGKYAYSGITRKKDSVMMRNEAELFANIP